MHREADDERKEKEIERLIAEAFQKKLSENEDMLSCTMAQKLYNKICAILAIVPGILGKH